jgi:hypothetical protein
MCPFLAFFQASEVPQLCTVGPTPQMNCKFGCMIAAPMNDMEFSNIHGFSGLDP